MPKIEEFQTSELLDSLLEQLQLTFDPSSIEEVDAITFATSPEHLGLTLYPRQELLLRLFYNLPLSEEQERDLEELRTCNNKYASMWLTPLRPGCDHYQFLLLLCGRRGTKTTIGAVIEAYEIYKLLRIQNPQKHYKFVPGQTISLLNTAVDERQALILFGVVKALLSSSKWFTRLTTRALETLYAFPNGIVAESLHSNSRSIRGRTAKMALFDELDHFSATSGPNSDMRVYQALAPSVKSFGKEGIVVIMTSPATEGGFVHELMQQVQKGIIPNAIVAQLATWELNPTITRQDLDSEYMHDFDYAESEFGGQFKKPRDAFLPSEAVDNCVDYNLPKANTTPVPCSCVGAIHVIHCDTALKSNRVAIVVGHYDPMQDQKGMVAEHIKYYDPKDSNGLIDMKEVGQYLASLHKIYTPKKITLDQFNSASIVQELRLTSCHAEEQPATSLSNMEMYADLRTAIVTGRIWIPEDELTIDELKALERSWSGKNRFKVEAPTTGPIRTDDVADALASVVHNLSRYQLINRRGFLSVSSAGRDEKSEEPAGVL